MLKQSSYTNVVVNQMRLSQVGMSRKYRVRHNFLFSYNYLIKFLVRSNIHLWYVKLFCVHAFWEDMNIIKTQNYTWRHNKVVDLLKTHVKIDKIILWNIIILIAKSRATFRYIFTTSNEFSKRIHFILQIFIITSYLARVTFPITCHAKNIIMVL